MVGLGSAPGLAPSCAWGAPGQHPARYTLPGATVGIKGCPGLSRWSVGTPPPPLVNVCSGLKLRVSGQRGFEAGKGGGQRWRGARHLGSPVTLTLVPQVPGAAAGVAALATGHVTAGEGQEDPAGAGRKQRPQLRRRLLPPGEPPCRCVMGAAKGDAANGPPSQSHGAGGGGMVPALTQVPLSRQSWSPCLRDPRSPSTMPSVRSLAPGSSGRMVSSSDSRREQTRR